MDPEFPLRFIWSDGEVEEIATIEELLERFETFDSVEARDSVWIRDAEDRTVSFAVNGRTVTVLEAASS